MSLSVVLILLIVLFCGLATVFCPNTFSGVFCMKFLWKNLVLLYSVKQENVIVKP